MDEVYQDKDCFTASSVSADIAQPLKVKKFSQETTYFMEVSVFVDNNE